MYLYDTNSHKFVLLSYKLVNTNSHKIHVTRKKLNHGGTSSPAGCCIASLRPLIVPTSCPAQMTAVALAVALSITCRRCAVRRHCAATTVTASALLPLRCCRRAVRRRRTVIAAVPPPSCRHCRCRCRRSAVCWLVVVLLSAVQFRHRMPSCNY